MADGIVHVCRFVYTCPCTLLYADGLQNSVLDSDVHNGAISRKGGCDVGCVSSSHLLAECSSTDTRSNVRYRLCCSKSWSIRNAQYTYILKDLAHKL